MSEMPEEVYLSQNWHSIYQHTTATKNIPENTIERHTKYIRADIYEKLQKFCLAELSRLAQEDGDY